MDGISRALKTWLPALVIDLFAQAGGLKPEKSMKRKVMRAAVEIVPVAVIRPGCVFPCATGSPSGLPVSARFSP